MRLLFIDVEHVDQCTLFEVGDALVVDQKGDDVIFDAEPEVDDPDEEDESENPWEWVNDDDWDPDEWEEWEDDDEDTPF